MGSSVPGQLVWSVLIYSHKIPSLIFMWSRVTRLSGVWARERVDPDLRLNKYDNCVLLFETNGSTRFQVFMESTDSLQWQWHQRKLILRKDISLVPIYASIWRSIITSFWRRKWSLASTPKYWKYPVKRMENGLYELRISRTVRQTHCSFAESSWPLVWVILAYDGLSGSGILCKFGKFNPRAVVNPKSQPIFPLSRRSSVIIAELWFTPPNSKQT